MNYTANTKRYDNMIYRRCGNSGLKLPAVSLGLWQNFGSAVAFDSSKERLLRAFDLGITYFDLANNYGPLPGSAEETLGKVLSSELKSYRDEIIVSTKAGYDMWKGPYGNFGSRKHIISSLDQSLLRLGLDYVDIFYHHRFDPDTPLYETMGALCDIVRQGKALYIGLSNYSAKDFQRAAEILQDMGVRILIAQPKYSMLERSAEEELLPLLKEKGIGAAVYSPLAQGLLTGRYLNGVPSDSRAAVSDTLNQSKIDDELLGKIRMLSMIAVERGQTVAQLALSWALKNESITSVIIGASRVEQLEENVKAIDNLSFTDDELQRIEDILK